MPQFYTLFTAILIFAACIILIPNAPLILISLMVTGSKPCIAASRSDFHDAFNK